jgi:hypothetical protein
MPIAPLIGKICGAYNFIAIYEELYIEKGK